MDPWIPVRDETLGRSNRERSSPTMGDASSWTEGGSSGGDRAQGDTGHGERSHDLQQGERGGPVSTPDGVCGKRTTGLSLTRP